MYRVREKFNSLDDYRAFYTSGLNGYDLSIDYITKDDYKQPSLHRWQWAYEKIKQLPIKTILDVGSWTGRFDVFLDKQGYEVECVEGNKDVAEYFKEVSDIKMHNVLFEDFVPDKKYDLVMFFEVIEHVFDMDLFLKKVDDCSVKYIMLSTPSDTGCFNDYNDIHLWMANEQSIRETFKDWNILELKEQDLILMLAERK